MAPPSVLHRPLIGVTLLLGLLALCTPTHTQHVNQLIDIEDARELDLLRRHPRRIISFNAASSTGPHSKFTAPRAFNQVLVEVPSQPAPVHEEQNEPPPPPLRIRASLDPLMLNPPGFAVDAARNFGAVPSGPVNIATNPVRPPVPSFVITVPAPPPLPTPVPGIVQLHRVPIIPNAPSRIIPPPPPEEVPLEAGVIQPLSLDPQTGLPLKTTSPHFRALISPRAPSLNIPSNIKPFSNAANAKLRALKAGTNSQSFGNGGGFANYEQRIVHRPSTNFRPVEYQGRQQQQQYRSPILLQSTPSGSFSNSNYVSSHGGATSTSQTFNSPSIGSVAEPSSGGLRSFDSSDDGDIISVQTFGGSSSSQDFDSTNSQRGFGANSDVYTGPTAAPLIQSSPQMIHVSHNLPGTGSSFSSTVFH